MILTTNYVDIAGSIEHVNVSKYLTDLGWKVLNTNNKRVKIFQLDNDGRLFQVNLPIDKELCDYKYAMYNAVLEIAASSNKSVEQVILELTNPLSDVIRLRIVDKDILGGSILFEDAINLYENAKKLLIATAMDILSPRVIHQGRPDDRVLQFIKGCRFGQTEIGSYIVSVICPFACIDVGGYTQLSWFSEESQCATSITRKVTNRLLSSIRHIKDVIDDGTIDEFIQTNVDDGVNISTNFLEALNSINIYKESSSLEIFINWAPTVKENVPMDSNISISHEYFTAINSVVQRMKSQKEDIKTFLGMIKRLDANPDADRRQYGIVSFVYMSSDSSRSTRTASIKLGVEEYQQAIMAHQTGKLVKVTGVLSGQKKHWITHDSFEIFE